MLSGLTCEELTAGLDGVAQSVLDEAGAAGPPIDTLAVARALGLAVAMDDRQDGRARYVRLSRARPKATIFLRPDPRTERRQWAVAHEIGEHVACRVFDWLGVDPAEVAPGAREQVANQLAARLLVPSDWFAGDAAACAWDLLELKARYATASHELIARRILECRPPVIITIFDQGRVYFRRSNVRGRVPPLSGPERRCWETVHRLGVRQFAADGLCAIQGWPVHEQGWRREILRTEVDEYALDQD